MKPDSGMVAALGRGLAGVITEAVDDMPAIRRVRCLECGRMQQAETAECMVYGWPKCCEKTMTIDAPGKQDAKP